MRRRQLPGEPPPPAKAELKRQAQSARDLAESLLAMPADRLAGLPLTEELRDAIHLAHRITSHGAMLRQTLYVAKLLRSGDPQPIRDALDSAASAARADAIRFQRTKGRRG